MFGVGNSWLPRDPSGACNYLIVNKLASTAGCRVALHLPTPRRRTVSRLFHRVPLAACSSQCYWRSEAETLLIALAAAVACLLACAVPPLAAQHSTVAEYRNEANFLATFPSFVDWPESVFPSAQAPFLICVRGDFSFGTALAEFARGASPHGGCVDGKWMHKDQELRVCQIGFVSRSESKRYAKVLQAVDGTGVLTVGETPDSLAAGGIISFAVERELLQFEVNLVAADSARLKISSRLLTLARRLVNRAEGAKG